KVTGLSGQSYHLKIDGNDVGKFTKDELAKGINLALLPTPMLKQSLAVHQLTLKHNQIHFERWRQVQVPLAHLENTTPEIRKALQDLMKAIDDREAGVVKEQRASAKPL